MNNTYNQQQIDERFEGLIQYCHNLGFHKLAAHYAKAVGMQRIHAIRNLEALISIRKQNERRRVRAYAVAGIALLVLALVFVIWNGGTP